MDRGGHVAQRACLCVCVWVIRVLLGLLGLLLRLFLSYWGCELTHVVEDGGELKVGFRAAAVHNAREEVCIGMFVYVRVRGGISYVCTGWWEHGRFLKNEGNY